MKKRIDDEFLHNNPLKYTDQNKYNINLLKNNISLEDFLLECPKNQMLSYFIDPLSLKNISFVGLVEEMQKSIYIFNKKFNLDVSNRQINVNNKKNINEKYFINKEVEKKFKKRNEREYEIYTKSKEIFNLY